MASPNVTRATTSTTTLSTSASSTTCTTSPPTTKARKSTTTSDTNTEHSYSSSIANLESLSSKEKRFHFLKIKCDRIRHFILQGRAPPGLSRGEMRNLRNQAKVHILDRAKETLYYTGGKVDIKKRVVTDMEEVNDIMKHCHTNNPAGGHSGINGTLTKISQHYTWNGMKEDVSNFVSSCERCKGGDRAKNRAPLAKTMKLKLTQALEVVGMSFIGPLPASNEGCKFVLAFTDYYTKFVDFFPLKTKSITGVTWCIKTYIYRWGTPKSLLLSQDEDYITQLNTEIGKSLNFPGLIVTSSDHPQTSSLSERTSQMLTTHLNQLVTEKPDNWARNLEELAYSIRTQEQTPTKSSPFFLMFGRHPRSSAEMESITDLMSMDVADHGNTVEPSRRGAEFSQRSAHLTQLDDEFRSHWKGTCLDSAYQILQMADYENLKFRTETTEDNEYMVITKIGTFGVVGLPTDLASLTLDRHGKLTYQAVYQQAVEHRLFDGEAFDVATFCGLLRKLTRTRFCRGIPEAHIADGDMHCVKTLGYPVLRYQAEKCQIFYEQSGSSNTNSESNNSRTPYRCVSCKYASKFLLKKNKLAKHPVQNRRELKRPLPMADFYSEVTPRGSSEWIDRSKDRCPQPGGNVLPDPMNTRPHVGTLANNDCHDFRDIVQAINSECNVDLSDVVFNSPTHVNSVERLPSDIR
ncbi:uncharacterized protein LOC110981605 [Acanthaster planci]|uniref:Uncharacterized protein LOC110981605 n=1 Tax=Acanthaster planci TaxID=133434 RepID=A0A8B7YQP0_ACAPL|nr:uncharacterized protein LOC110981605 [Acanthaster planci]